ncbi:polyprenyl synthetase family protein [Streptomyces sp. NPDC004838]
MSPSEATAAAADIANALASMESLTDDFLAEKSEEIPEAGPVHLVDSLRSFMRGGKRVRPRLVLAGWVMGGGGEFTDSVVRVAASLELFHTSTLIHQDVMDGNDTRRGRPAVHRMPTEGRDGRAGKREGLGTAVLLGDLASLWSGELLETAPLTPTQRAATQPLISRMRSEAVVGQYLDFRSAGNPVDDIDAVLRTSRYRTGKYGIERPLQIGASLAGAGPAVLSACSDVALPLGDAFRLCDDLLGVYGNPRTTGRTRLEALRAGKGKSLVAHALRACDPARREQLRRLAGDPRLDEAGAAEILAALTDTGARQAVERLARQRYAQVLRALNSRHFSDRAIAMLMDIAQSAAGKAA